MCIPKAHPEDTGKKLNYSIQNKSKDGLQKRNWYLHLKGSRSKSPLLTYHTLHDSLSLYLQQAAPCPLTKQISTTGPRCIGGTRSQGTTSYLLHTRIFLIIRKTISWVGTKTCSVHHHIFGNGGPERYFPWKVIYIFQTTNASFLLRRIICTTDLYLKIEGRIYAKMISGDHLQQYKKVIFCQNYTEHSQEMLFKYDH